MSVETDYHSNDGFDGRDNAVSWSIVCLVRAKKHILSGSCFYEALGDLLHLSLLRKAQRFLQLSASADWISFVCAAC